jgi:hypothetical protein
MQAEVEELPRILSMASSIAAMLEQCEQAPQGAVASTPPRRAADRFQTTAIASMRSTASDVQKVQLDAFRQLMESTLMAARHLSSAATLALQSVAGRDVDGAVASGTVPHQERASEDERRPLGEWVRAVAGLEPPPDRVSEADPVVSAAVAAEAPGTDETLVDTRVTARGPATMENLLAIYQKIDELPGVKEVLVLDVKSESAELAVKHTRDVDLADAVSSLLHTSVRVSREESGVLLLELPRPRA